MVLQNGAHTDDTDIEDGSITSRDGRYTHSKKGKTSTLSRDGTTRDATSDVALDVDIMILDYQSYVTTQLLLDPPGSKKSRDVRRSMIATDAFVKIFHQHHAQEMKSPSLRVRLLLLQFTALYMGRLTRDESTPSQDELAQLRAERVARLRRWIAKLDRIPTLGHDVSRLEAMQPLDGAQLSHIRQHVLQSLNATEEDPPFYGTADSLSLLDLLPRFMELCSLTHQLAPWPNMTRLMHLMIEFMLQASLEQYLIYGVGETLDPVDEAFAYGCYADALVESYEASVSTQHNVSLDHKQGHGPAVASEDSTTASALHGSLDSTDDISPSTESLDIATSQTKPAMSLTETDMITDRMFRDTASNAESEIWTTAKAFTLGELVHNLDNVESVPAHLAHIATLRPVETFDAHVRSFLGECMTLIKAPVLLQIEHGQLEGMTKDQTTTFLRSCGVSRSGHLL